MQAPTQTRAQLRAARKIERQNRRKNKLRHGGTYGGLLTKTGDLTVQPIEGTAWHAQDGIHEIRTPARYYVKDRIPEGSWLTLWFEGNPEPLNSQDPKGYTSQHVARLVGGVTANIVTGGFTPVKQFTAGKWIWIGVLVVGLAVGAYLWYQQRFP